MADSAQAKQSEQHLQAYRRERLAQLRGLLVLAAGVLALVLYRARGLHLFHAGWWRP